VAKTTHGYVIIRVPGHPNARKDGNIGEHRYVMAEVLGRPLFPGENVHHINGIRDDNRPENLELWVSSQPSGQRVIDLVKWAKEILDRYEGMVDCVLSEE
jgi:HNH endonuclease